MALDVDVREHLEQALEGQPEWLEVHTRLEGSTAKGDEERYRPFVFAFGYMLRERSRRARRERGEGPFGSAMSHGDWQFPPPLQAIEHVDVEAWQAAVEELDDDVASARLNDLLWERRASGRADLNARAASDAYLAVSAYGHWHWVERSTCLTRALDLARAVGDRGRVENVVRTGVGFVEQVLGLEDRAPGPAMVILRSFLDLDENQQPAELVDLLDMTSQRWGDDPHIFEAVSDLQARLASPERLAGIRRAQVARWREIASKGDAMLRVAFLERALETARVHGLTEEADDIRRELQEISPDDLALETITSQVSLTGEEVGEVVDQLIDQDSWEQSLRQFGTQGPPGGSPEDIADGVHREAEEFPLTQLFTKSVMGHGTAASRLKATTEDQRRKLDEAERRAFHASFWSILFVRVLREIPKRHGRPPREDITAFFNTELIGPVRAERIARAMELFWESQADECAHILVPRLESILRDMARRAGLPIIREPVGDKPGGVRTLGVLLRELGGAMPEPGWHAYLVNLLTDECGINLRNSIAHGLKEQIGPGDAALLIQAACYLQRLRASPEQQQHDSEANPM